MKTLKSSIFVEKKALSATFRKKKTQNINFRRKKAVIFAYKQTHIIFEKEKNKNFL
jgi:hypothetical protein